MIYSRIKLYNNLYNILFIIGMGLLFISCSNIEVEEFKQTTRYSVFISLLVLLFKAYFIGIEKRRIPLLILILILVLSYIYNNFFINHSITGYDLTLFYTLVFLLCFDIRNEKIFKIALISKIVFTLTIIILNFIGLIPNVLMDRGGTEIIRQSLGFASPNILSVVFLSITIDIIYLLKEKNKINTINIFLLILLNILIYFISNSRTSFLIIMFFIVGSFLLFNSNYKYFIISSNYIRIFILLLIILLSILTSFYYNPVNEFLSNFNQLLTGRLAMSNYFIETFGIKALGTNIPESTIITVDYIIYTLDQPWLVDSAFLRILLTHGYIFFLLFLIVIFKSIKDSKLDRIDFLIILVIFIYGLTERYAMNIFIFELIFLLILKNNRVISNSN